MCADLTAAGYGPHPQRTLTWRQFWFAWATVYQEREKKRLQDENFQLWLATLQAAPKAAEKTRAKLEASAAEAEVLVADQLRERVPDSVLALLDLPTPHTSEDALNWWQRKLAEAPDDGVRKWLEAGYRAARRRHGHETVH